MNLRKAFIFFGPPGAGKGTISRRCVEELGWKQLSTGDLFRKHINEKTTLGKTIEKAISEGKLVNDVTVIDIVYDWIMQNKNGITPLIFDGFPRTLKQAELLLQKMAQDEMHRVVIVLDIADQVVIERLLMRRTCQNNNCQKVYSVSSGNVQLCTICGSDLYQRTDDMVDTINHRLSVYHQHANQLLKFYEDNHIEIKRINAHQPVDEVFREVLVAAGEIQ